MKDIIRIHCSTLYSFNDLIKEIEDKEGYYYDEDGVAKINEDDVDEHLIIIQDEGFAYIEEYKHSAKDGIYHYEDTFSLDAIINEHVFRLTSIPIKYEQINTEDLLAKIESLGFNPFADYDIGRITIRKGDRIIAEIDMDQMYSINTQFYEFIKMNGNDKENIYDLLSVYSKTPINRR